MKRKKVPENNSSLKNKILTALGLIPIAADTLSVIGWINGREFPWPIFLVLFCCLNLILISSVNALLKMLLSIRNSYINKRDELYIAAESNEALKKDFGFSVESLERKYIHKTRDCLRAKGLKCLIPLVLLVVFFIFNPTNTKAFWNGIQHRPAVETNTHPETESDEETNNESDIDSATEPENKAQNESSQNNDETKSAEEVTPERVLKPHNYRFVLSNPDRTPELKEEIIEQVYFYGTTSEMDLEDYIPVYFKMLSEQKKPELDSNSITDENGNTFSFYAIQENDFKERVESFCYIEYLDEWNQNAPNSTELDQLIEGRTELNTVETNGVSGCHELWWRLANDYQYYAQEYEYQTKNKDAILYYYTMSIYCCMEALKYDLDSDEYNMIFYYMKARYTDLSSEGSCVSKDYKLRAGEIVSVLSEK